MLLEMTTRGENIFFFPLRSVSQRTRSSFHNRVHQPFENIAQVRDGNPAAVSVRYLSHPFCRSLLVSLLVSLSPFICRTFFSSSLFSSPTILLSRCLPLLWNNSTRVIAAFFFFFFLLQIAAIPKQFLFSNAGPFHDVRMMKMFPSLAQTRQQLETLRNVRDPLALLGHILPDSSKSLERCAVFSGAPTQTMSRRRTTHPPEARRHCSSPRLMVMGPRSASEMDRKGTFLLSSDKRAMKKDP